MIAAGSALRRRIARLAGGSEGFTVIEVMVATLVLTVGMLSLVGAFDSGRRLSTSAEEHQTAAAIAQRELQRIEALPWASIGLTADPTQPTGVKSTDPTYYENAGPCITSGASIGPASSPCYQWDWSTSTALEPLVISASADATVNPQSWSTTVTAGGTVTRLSGKIYRFITWVSDSHCTLSDCGAASDYKRIVVAVTGTGLDKPVTLTTLVTNPVGSSQDPLQAGTYTCTDGASQVSCISQS